MTVWNYIGYYFGRPDVIIPCKLLAEHTDGNVICLMQTG